MRRMKGQNTCQGAARYCFIFQMLAVLSVASFLIPGCDKPNIVGIHQPYGNESVQNNVTSSCNLGCACVGVQFEPVCGIDNRTYFSPCHMGCLRKVNRDFASCQCLDPSLSQSSPRRIYINESGSFVDSEIDAMLGQCDRNCKNMVPFLCAIVVLLILNFVNAVPGKMVVMRCVPDNERAYALGVQWIILTLLGAIPGPLLFGIFIDKTCNLWEITCHGQGNCLAYDNEILSYRLAAAIFIFEALAAICYFISWKSFKPVDEKDIAKTLDSITGSNSLFSLQAASRVETPRSPDLTITTELSNSCLSITDTTTSKGLLDAHAQETSDYLNHPT